MSGNEKWHIIKKIFSEAIELEDSKRKEFIKKSCEGDSYLISEVWSLIKASKYPSPIDQSIAPLTAGVFETKNLCGKKIGSYKILKEIDHGGMGTVYLAERDDGHFEQKVALKLLKNGFSTTRQIQQFVAERQILATLNHDHIARLLDGGVTEDGQPWFAMEHVEGLPIDLYCEMHCLNLQDRLSLFLDVCNAVQYAHHKLIIHRDLKPSNILVTDSGSIKLLDFGIAKVLNPDKLHGIRTEEITKGLMPLTPEYASPEQTLNHPITVASDIYQLGVILYELLTGKRPYKVEGTTPEKIEQAVCKTIPIPPSSALNTKEDLSELSLFQSVNKIRKELRGDLDAIILKTLLKEPEKRYHSVGQFTADIKRYLKGYPVRARQDSVVYRAHKFIQRNKLGVASFSAIILMVLIYLVTVTNHSQQIEMALNQAQMEAEKSEQIINYMMGMFKSGNPKENLGETVTANMLLNRGIEQADQLRDQPGIQAQMYDVIGRAYRELGEYDKAYPLLEKSLEIWKEHKPESDLTLADAYYNLGTVLHHMGDYRESDINFKKAVQIYEQKPGLESTEYASSLYAIASMLTVQRDYETAEDYHKRALKMRVQLPNEDPTNIGASYEGLGLTLFQSGQPENALEMLQNAYEIYLNHYSLNHPEIAQLLITRSRVLQYFEETNQAEKDLKDALEIYKSVYGENHTKSGVAKKALGDFYRSTNKYALAETLYQEILNSIAQTNEESHPLKRPVLQALSRLYLETGNYRAAEPTLRETVQLLESVLNPNHPRLSSVRRELGLCLTYLGNYEDAEVHLLKSLTSIQNRSKNNGYQQEEIAESLEALVELYEQWGNSEKMTTYSNHLAQLSDVN
jgi:eukaryotic-like serine/threonine-protein kinase